MAKKHCQGLSTRDKQCSQGICTKDAIAWDEVTKEGYCKTHKPQLDKLKATLGSNTAKIAVIQLREVAPDVDTLFLYRVLDAKLQQKHDNRRA